MKFTTYLTLFLLFSFEATSQISFGLKAGGQLTNISNREFIEQVFPSIKSIPTFNYGVVINNQISDKIDLESSLLASNINVNVSETSKNTTFMTIPLEVSGNGNQKISYFSIPFIITYKPKSSLPLHLVAGLNYSFLDNINSELKVKTKGFLPFEIDFKNTINTKSQVFGLLGLRAERNFKNHILYLEAIYSHGFSSLLEISLLGQEFKARTMNLNIGYRYAIKGRAKSGSR